MYVKPDKYPLLKEVFTSSDEFFKYFQDMTAILMSEKECSQKSQSSLSYLIPSILELDYVENLKQIRLFFPKFSDRVVVQIPKKNFQTEEQIRGNISFFASLVKEIEVDLIIKLSAIKKLFDLKQNLKGKTKTQKKTNIKS